MKLLLIIAFWLSAISANAIKTIHLQKYLDADTLSAIDATPAIRKALEDCARTHADELLLPEGILNLKPDCAFER